MSKKERIIISVLVLWTFLLSFLLILSFHNDGMTNNGYNEYPQVRSGSVERYTKHIDGRYDRFFPFTYSNSLKTTNSGYFNIEYYDYTEFLIYVVLAWIIFFLYRFVNKDK